MDPVTHAAIGAALAKLTGSEISILDPVTTGMMLGSIFPDIDILLQKWGDYVYLKHHRGATHSILGLIGSAILIASALCLIYPGSGFAGIFLASLAGCFSHTFFDLFNSYGAKLFWPFSKKMFSFSLLLSFDPVFIGLLAGYVLYPGNNGLFFMAAFVTYFFSRLAMRRGIEKYLDRLFGKHSLRISLLPSLTSLLKWQFIIETEDYNIIGEKRIFSRRIRFVRTLPKIDRHQFHTAKYSRVGEFFKEFTPLFHVTSEVGEEFVKYTFIDMRYFLRDDFLHHAVLEINGDDIVIRQSFNPYSMKRSVEIPE